MKLVGLGLDHEAEFLGLGQTLITKAKSLALGLA